MASPKAGKFFPSSPTPIPGQGQNVALDALRESSERDVQRSQITAGLQQEAMRMAMEGAKLKAAAAQDVSRGITEASQAFATQAENKQQQTFLATEAQKAREAQATRAKTQQDADLTRQVSLNDANKVNADATRTAEKEHRQAVIDQNTAEARLSRLDIEIDALQKTLTSGIGFSRDETEASSEYDRIKNQIHTKNDERLQLGRGESRAVLEEGFAISMATSLGTKQNAAARTRSVQQLKISESKRAQAIKTKEQQFLIQVPAFAAMKGANLIDGGLAEGVSAEEMSNRYLLHHSSRDMSNPKSRGFGLLRAMAMDTGRDPKLLNRVQAKLGPFGMATLDAIAITVNNVDTELGDPATPEIRSYRSEVLSRVSSKIARARQNKAYSAIQQGFSLDAGRIFIDDFRQEHSRPPTPQEYMNFKQGLKLDHLPGSMDMKFIYAAPSGPASPGDTQSRSAAPYENLAFIDQGAVRTAESLRDPTITGDSDESMKGQRAAQALKQSAGGALESVVGGIGTTFEGAETALETGGGFFKELFKSGKKYGPRTPHRFR